MPSLAAVIFGGAHLLGVREFPVVIALLFAIVIALPLGMWIFAPLRRRANASIAAIDERRRQDREQLQARLRGDEPPEEVTAAMSREAFGAEFVGAEGFLNSPTYGLPPQFMFDALQDCLRTWQAGTMDVPSFDESVSAGRAGYAALVGVPVDSVTMARHRVVRTRTGRRRHSRRQPGGDSARRIHQHQFSVRRPGGAGRHRHRAEF